MLAVADGRPYPPTGLTTDLWLRLPVETVDVQALITTQPHLHIDALLTPRPQRDPYPNVVEHDGALYLEDGHHRVTRLALAGERYILARVYRPRE